MAGFSIKLTGDRKLKNTLDSDIVKNVMARGLRSIVFKAEALIKQATPVDKGRLRSSIKSQIHFGYGVIGTNVKYASFVEYGTEKMEARHVEGGAVQKGLPGIGKAKLIRAAGRVLGVGPFAYGLEKLKEWLGKAEKDMAKDVEGKF